MASIRFSLAVCVLLVLQLTPISSGAKIAPNSESVKTSKRSLVEFQDPSWAPSEWNPWNNPGFGWNAPKPVPTQREVSNAIAAAKQASENVLIAQQQMIAAKENVLQQQKLASERESNAQIAQQKLESVAAIQRSESAAAAQSVILAQQRLAATKAALAHHQKIASVKEAHAAEFLQKTAHAAAIEIQRTENEAEKLSTIHRNGAAASLHNVAATKDALLAPIIIGSNRVPHPHLGPNPYSLAPWSTAIPIPGMTRAFVNSFGGLGGSPTGPPPSPPVFPGQPNIRNSPGLYWK